MKNRKKRQLAEHVRIIDSNNDKLIATDPLFATTELAKTLFPTLETDTKFVAMTFGVLYPMERLKSEGTMYTVSIGIAPILSVDLRPMKQQAAGVVHDVITSDIVWRRVPMLRVEHKGYILPAGTEPTDLLRWVKQTIAVNIANGVIESDIIEQRDEFPLPEHACRKVTDLVL